MDIPHSEPTRDSGPPPSPDSPRLTLPAVVLQFFIFPLAVVVVCALLFLLVGWMTYEARGPRELLAAATDTRTGRESRLLAAAEFARILEGHVREARRGRRSPDDPVTLPPEIQALAEPTLEAFRKPLPGDSRDLLQAYLAAALGLFRHRPAVPHLVEALEGAAPGLRIPLLGALGNIGDPAAAPPLLAALANADAGVRKQAAFGLGLLRDARAVAPLKARLQDPAHDVRWNAALALVRFRDDPGAREAARPVLVQMLDRPYVQDVVAQAGADRQRGLNAVERAWDGMWEGMAFSTDDLVTDVMANAMRGVVLLGDRSFEERLDAIGRGDANLKVRDLAMQTLAALRGPP